jgi:hypothetical protein
LPIIKAAFYSILYLDIESFIKNWKQSGLTYRLNFSMDGVSKGIQSFLNIVILILLRVQVLWTIPFVALTSSIFILMLSSDNSPEKLLSLLRERSVIDSVIGEPRPSNGDGTSLGAGSGERRAR